MRDTPRLVAETPVVGDTYDELVAAASALGDALEAGCGHGFDIDLHDAHPVGVARTGGGVRWEATARIVIPAASAF